MLEIVIGVAATVVVGAIGFVLGVLTQRKPFKSLQADHKSLHAEHKKTQAELTILRQEARYKRRSWRVVDLPDGRIAAQFDAESSLGLESNVSENTDDNEENA